MCLWGVSPIRLILKLTAGTTKIPPFERCFCLIFFQVAFCCCNKLNVSVVACSPRWNNAPEMLLSVAYLSHNTFNSEIVEYCDKTPVFYCSRLLHNSLKSFLSYIGYALIIFLVCGSETNKGFCPRQKFELCNLVIFASFTSFAFVD